MSRLRNRRPHVVIVIGNIPVTKDRRVVRQAKALVEAGARVSIICPSSGAQKQSVPGCSDVAVLTYRRPLEGRGALGFAVEFAWAFLRTAECLIRLNHRDPVDVVQFCNPPDVFGALMLILRKAGRRVVFDHHDLSPEIYDARGSSRAAIRWLLRAFERSSLRWSDHVIATNETFRDVGTRRGGVPDGKITIVRNGPTIADIGAVEPALPAPDDEAPTVIYLGVFGRQDGVDAFVRMAAEVRSRRPDVHFVMVGDGETFPAVRTLVSELGFRPPTFRLTGWLDAGDVHGELSRATVAVQPDPRNRMNECSTMAKTVEYLAHGLPVVAVDLIETRRSAGSAAVYVDDADPRLLADAVLWTLESPEQRGAMAREGRRRVGDELAWDYQAQRYVDVFRAWLPSLIPAPDPRLALRR